MKSLEPAWLCHSSATGNQLWHQNVPGVIDAVESGDFFGDFQTGDDKAPPP